MYSPSSAADALRRALAKLEANHPGDPKIAELKRKALLRLADIQQRPKRPRPRLLVFRPSSAD